MKKEFFDKLSNSTKHMSSGEVTAFEERYRDKGSVQLALKVLESQIGLAADEITKIVPNLHWKWDGGSGSIGCPEDPEADTQVTRMASRIAWFDGPIPEQHWTQVRGIVLQRAEILGMTDSGKFHDDPHNHDIYFTSPNGGVLQLGSAKEATLAGKTSCRLFESWYTEHNLPIPGTK